MILRDIQALKTDVDKIKDENLWLRENVLELQRENRELKNQGLEKQRMVTYESDKKSSKLNDSNFKHNRSVAFEDKNPDFNDRQLTEAHQSCVMDNESPPRIKPMPLDYQESPLVNRFF